MDELDIKCVVSAVEAGGAVAVFEELVPQGSGPPRHTHREQTEVFHVIEGRIRFEVSGETFEREGGSVALVPAGAVHAFRNVGESPALIRFELIPAGKSEEAFERLTTETITDIKSFFDEYGMDLAGPPLGD